MKYTGTFTEIDEELSFDECDDWLNEVIVTKDRIAFDWTESDLHLGTTLHRKPHEPSQYFGDITVREDPKHRGYISACRYDLKGGDILLLAKWNLYDGRGTCVFELHRE